LASVERRAYRKAEIATGNLDDAMDILQDAMYKLAQKYAGNPANEWGPLFHTILQSRIMDYHRRKTVRNKYFSWFSSDDKEGDLDPIQSAVDLTGKSPEEEMTQDASMEILDGSIRQLPARQQQAFMFRAFEGLDVAETAKMMKCSEGSVKTHYSRALSKLRVKLGDYKI
jgi:RNA polymerase sigma-70 factor (ECF subfamily)